MVMLRLFPKASLSSFVSFPLFDTYMSKPATGAPTLEASFHGPNRPSAASRAESNTTLPLAVQIGQHGPWQTVVPFHMQMRAPYTILVRQIRVLFASPCLTLFAPKASRSRGKG